MSKIVNINNPLTLIGLFAGLTETICAVVLPFLTNPDLQKSFLFFVIGFPILIVIAFFLTLNFNKGALYAPKDYPDNNISLAKLFLNKKNISKTKIQIDKKFNVFIDNVNFSTLDKYLIPYLEFSKLFITRIMSLLTLDKFDEFRFDIINDNFYLLEIRISKDYLKNTSKYRHIFILLVDMNRDYDSKNNKYISDNYTYGIIVGSGHGKPRQNADSLADYVVSSIKKELKMNGT